MNTLEGGANVGRYRIERFLGAGAMGEVYLALDPHIDRRLAIKTVRLTGRPQDIEDRKKRLLREARAAGRLLHPYIVTLFDAGEHEGILYLAFEYVEGSDLSTRLDGGAAGKTGPAFSLGEVLRIVRQTAEALDYAHRQGIVHRDIKPSNILIDAAGRVKVADFGIAKIAGQSTELTVAGSVMGSPQYLSPEQIRGDELDGRSDLFSLGVVLFELLSGRRPFDGDTITTLVYQILHQDAPSISELRAVPPRLEQLLRDMLAKDRDARLANAAEVAEQIAVIERELPDETLSAPAPSLFSPLERTHALPRRTTASAPGVVPPPPLPTPSPSTRVSQPGPHQGAGPPPVPPPLPTPTMQAPAVAGAAPLHSWGPIVVVLALLLALATALAFTGWHFGWRLLSIGKSAPQDEMAATVPTSPMSTDLTTDGTGTLLPTDAPPSEERDDRPAEPAPRQTQPSREAEAVPPQQQERQPVLPRPTERPAPETERPSPQTPPRPIVEPAAPEPGPEAPRETERAVQVEADQSIRTGLEVAFQVTPPEAHVLVDRTMIGQAKEWSGRKGSRSYTLPGPGTYLVRVRMPGMREHRIAVEAGATGGTTPIVVRLRPLPAADVETSDLQVVKVRQAVAFRVKPASAEITIDGQPISAGEGRSGRFGRSADWLELPIGRHRASFVAPGYQRKDILIEVTPGAEEERESVSVVLVPGGN